MLVKFFFLLISAVILNAKCLCSNYWYLWLLVDSLSQPDRTSAGPKRPLSHSFACSGLVPLHFLHLGSDVGVMWTDQDV
jgi:hypothetical protein